MQYKRLILSVLLFLGLGLIGIQAQESFNAVGGNALGSGGTVSYSVGQVVYQSHAVANGSVAEGVQLPYEISVETAIDESAGIKLSVEAYPNPATDYLTLIIDEFDISRLSYHLYDMQGKLLQKGSIRGYSTSIVMSNLVRATYFVKVIQGKKEVKTFKIIKH